MHVHDSLSVICPQGPVANNINKCEKWSHKTTTPAEALKNLPSSPRQLWVQKNPNMLASVTRMQSNVVSVNLQYLSATLAVLQTTKELGEKWVIRVHIRF